MPAFLAVTDDGKLTPRGKAVVGEDFLPRDEYLPGAGGSGEPLPEHVSGVHLHLWIAPVYNPGAPCLAQIRGAIAAAMSGLTDTHIVGVGDSRMQGWNAGVAGKQPRWGWLGQLRESLGAVEGYVVAYTADADSRWSGNMVQGIIRQPGLIGTPGTTSQEMFTYDTPHTGASFWIYLPAGGNVTIAVDGGAGQVLAVPAGAGFHKVTPTVTGGERARTYALTLPGDAILHGFAPTYATPRLKITNLARGGMNAGAWRSGDLANRLGHWDAMMTVLTPDVILCALGTNQPSDNGTAGAADLTALWGDIGATGIPAVIMTPGGLDLTGTEDWFQQYEAQFKAADRWNLPLIDGVSVIGNGQQAQARGLMYDAQHENIRGFAWNAAAVRRLIT